MTRSVKLLILALLVVAAALLSLSAGRVWVPAAAWFGDDPRWWIIVELRAPRAVLGLMIGASLGLSGAVLQGYLRNPLADPAVVGVSSSAALGAVAAMYFGVAGDGFGLPLSAMLGAGGAVALLGLLVGRSTSAVAFILAGTVLASLSAALTALIISLSPSPSATSEIVTWLMGALTDRGWQDVRFALPFMAAGMAILLSTGRTLDTLTLGESVARSLGTRLTLLQWVVALGVGLTVGASVAVTGVVGFVGLIVPHLLRPLFGQRPGALLLPSMLGGALLLLVADTLVRLTPGAEELKLGVAMALIGAPFFFALLLTMRRHIA